LEKESEALGKIQGGSDSAATDPVPAKSITITDQIIKNLKIAE
jgi:hypothetical protein